MVWLTYQSKNSSRMPTRSGARSRFEDCRASLAAAELDCQVVVMDPSGLLSTIGEIAVALVGFSGVVAVLGQRGRGDWSSEELLQLRTLVEPGLVAVFGSLLPGIAHLAFESDAIAW